jgi:hypothetical protein
MSRGTPGKIVEIKDGIHKGKQGFAYHKDQAPEITAAKKICVTVPMTEQAGIFPGTQASLDWKKLLFDPANLSLVGYFD